MSLIDMSDRDKLFNYAKEFTPIKFRVFNSDENADSYYHDCGKRDDINDLAIMEYNVERFDILKNYLLDMWSKAGLKNPELLATMISAMVLKNMPIKKEPGVREKSDGLHDGMKKESCESVNDAPPVFVYEF